MADREGIAELLALVDRLERLLERSGLSELEIEHDGTTIVLRTPSAVAPAVAAVATPADAAGAFLPERNTLIEEPVRPRGAHAITAPLTGVYYRSPSPGAESYVREGGQVNAGQVIGLIEAMKLFNQIKVPTDCKIKAFLCEHGDAVKKGQPLVLIEE